MGGIAVLALLAVIFLAQNIEVVTVSFLVWKISLSLAVLIFFLLMFGLMIGWFLHSLFSYRKNKKEMPNEKI